jgi:hypothetical protein
MMRAKNLQLNAMRLADKPRWRAKVIAALEKHEGYIEAAADDLNVARRTLFYWLAEDDEIDRARERIVKQRREKQRSEKKKRDF